jgi:hypothetical protein
MRPVQQAPVRTAPVYQQPPARSEPTYQQQLNSSNVIPRADRRQHRDSERDIDRENQ